MFRFLLIGVALFLVSSISAVEKAEQLKLPKGFKAELLHIVDSKTQGSWVSMCFDNKGQIYASSQFGELYRIKLNEGEVSSIESVKSPGKAQGLLWAFDSLYMMVISGKNTGVWRLEDKDSDGSFESQQHILTLKSAGEHGSHGIISSPDGKGIIITAGNFTPLPENVPVRGTRNWGEDTILKHLPDSGGFSANVKAPGGWVMQLSPDGKEKEILATGTRNVYDLAVSPEGEIFSYDSDADRDAGMPFYRPTRVNHIVSGGEYGWRTGTSKWPEYYADSLGAVINIGPGSPTGLVFGTKAAFPEKYRRSLFILDWTYGRIYAIHLTPDGATYTGKKEIFVQGKPLPVTDADFGPDGAMYFTTGGRKLESALYRVIYTGDDVSKGELEPQINESVALRRTLEMHHRKSSNAVEFAWQHLGHKGRSIRYAARIAVENQSFSEYQDKFFAETDPQTVITASLSMARCAEKSLQSKILEKLLTLNVNQLSADQKIQLTRSYSLTFSRLGAPDGALKTKIVDVLSSLYPSKDEFLNRELCRLLVYLDAPGIVEKTIGLVLTSKDVGENFQIDYVPEYYTGGSAFSKMQDDLPNRQGLHYSLMLMSAEKGWNKENAPKLFKWLNTQLDKIGGRSYKGYISNIRRQIVSGFDEELKNIVANAVVVKLEKEESVDPPKGPGKLWTMDLALAAVKDLKGADRKNGEKMYKAVLCFKCHIRGGRGGEIGPDLNNLHTRFSKKDILDAIINPSKVVSEQFTNMEVQLGDGNTLIGQLVEKTDKELKIAMNPFDLQQVKTVNRKSVKSIKPSFISPMPPGLIYSLNEQELKDLMLYLTE